MRDANCLMQQINFSIDSHLLKIMQNTISILRTPTIFFGLVNSYIDHFRNGLCCYVLHIIIVLFEFYERTELHQYVTGSRRSCADITSMSDESLAGLAAKGKRKCISRFI